MEDSSYPDPTPPKYPPRWLEYLKALWPIAATIMAVLLFVKDQQRANDITNAIQDQRLEIIEDCQRDMLVTMDNLREQQSLTNANMATLNTGVDNLNFNVSRIIEILDQRY